MIEDNPTHDQRVMLGNLLHDALIEIRHLGWNGMGQQAADLADAVENIPTELFGVGVFQWFQLRLLLQGYQKKYEQENGTDYVSRLDRIRRSV